MIRVLIADDNAVIRSGVATLLEASADDIEVVAQAATGKEAIVQAQQSKPDVVLLDIRMPVMDGIEACGRLSGEYKVMMLSYAEEQSLVAAAIRAGADGYLVHGRFQPEELATAVRGLAAGQTVVSPAVASAVFGAVRDGGEPEAENRFELTEREHEVMALVAQGHSNAAIAERLVVSPATVKNHVHQIYTKLGVGRRAEAVAVWLGAADSASPPASP